MTEIRKKFTATAPKSTMNTVVMMIFALNLMEFVGLVLAMLPPVTFIMPLSVIIKQRALQGMPHSAIRVS